MWETRGEPKLIGISRPFDFKLSTFDFESRTDAGPCPFDFQLSTFDCCPDFPLSDESLPMRVNPAVPRHWRHQG